MPNANGEIIATNWFSDPQVRVAEEVVFHMIGLIVATPMLAPPTEDVDPGATGAAWSPYLVGALMGVLSMLTFYFSDKPLDARWLPGYF